MSKHPKSAKITPRGHNFTWKYARYMLFLDVFNQANFKYTPKKRFSYDESRFCSTIWTRTLTTPVIVHIPVLFLERSIKFVHFWLPNSCVKIEHHKFRQRWTFGCCCGLLLTTCTWCHGFVSLISLGHIYEVFLKSIIFLVLFSRGSVSDVLLIQSKNTNLCKKGQMFDIQAKSEIFELS